MPTKHRQKMIEDGTAPPHHGHDKTAVAQSKKLAAADQALLDAAEKDRIAAAKTAEAALAGKRARRAERHAAERQATKPGRKVR